MCKLSKVLSPWLLFLFWCGLTACGIVVPFSEEDWEKIFNEERNNYLYATDLQNNGRIHILQIDDNTGNLILKGNICSTAIFCLLPDRAGTALFSGQVQNFSYFSAGNSGMLTLQASFSLAETPQSMSLDASGRFVYCALTSSIYIFDRQAGSLTSETPFIPEASTLIQAIAADLKQHRLYTGLQTNTNAFYICTYLTAPADAAIDTNRAPLKTGNLDVPPQKICLHPNGRFLYTGNTITAAGRQIAAFSINADGSLSSLASYTVLESGSYCIGDLAMDPAGRYLFASAPGQNSGTLCVFTIDEETGSLAKKQNFQVREKNPRILVTDPWGRYLYMAIGEDKPAIYMYKIDHGALVELAGSPFIYDTSLTRRIECLSSLSSKS